METETVCVSRFPKNQTTNSILKKVKIIKYMSLPSSLLTNRNRLFPASPLNSVEVRIFPSILSNVVGSVDIFTSCQFLSVQSIFSHPVNTCHFGQYGHYGHFGQYVYYGHFCQCSQHTQYGQYVHYGQYGQYGNYGRHGQHRQYSHFGQYGHTERIACIFCMHLATCRFFMHLTALMHL